MGFARLLTQSASVFFCCFEMPIFRAYGTGDPSSSLGGVSDKANFHAKPCFRLSSFFWCFELLIFTSFWEVVFFFFFFKKNTSISWRCPNFAKNGCANFLDFLDNSQTSGRRRATSGRRRARNVWHGTSGKRRARRSS